MKQNPDGGFPVAIWEKNDVHEATSFSKKGTDGKNYTVETAEGELFIADDEVHDVTVTAEVSKALAEGRLIEVRGGKEVEYEAEDADTSKKK